MELENLIRDLTSPNQMLWVIGGGEVVSENTGKDMKEPTVGDGYITVGADSWHFHMKLDSVTGVQFVEAEDHGVPFLYYVRFSDAKEETLLRVYFPNPYLDDDEKREARRVSAGEAEAFRGLSRQVRGPGWGPCPLFVKRPRQTA